MCHYIYIYICAHVSLYNVSLCIYIYNIIIYNYISSVVVVLSLSISSSSLSAASGFGFNRKPSCTSRSPHIYLYIRDMHICFAHFLEPTRYILVSCSYCSLLFHFMHLRLLCWLSLLKSVRPRLFLTQPHNILICILYIYIYIYIYCFIYLCIHRICL